MSGSDLFDAHLKASVIAGHLLQAHAIKQYNEAGAAMRHRLALEQLHELAEMLGLQIGPRPPSWVAQGARVDVVLSR